MLFKNNITLEVLQLSSLLDLRTRAYDSAPLIFSVTALPLVGYCFIITYVIGIRKLHEDACDMCAQQGTTADLVRIL